MDKLLLELASLAGALLIKVLDRSCRIEIIGNSNDPMRSGGMAGKGAPIYVAWHQRMFAFFEFLGKRHVAVMISRSRDGEIVARASSHLGFRPIRGSSNRGAVPAARRLIKTLSRKRPVGFLADGPRGPARTAKPGPIAASRATGSPIVPVSWNADRKWVLRSWDRYFIPKPFAKVVLYIGEPILVCEEADRAELENARKDLESALDRICAMADRHFEQVDKRTSRNLIKSCP